MKANFAYDGKRYVIGKVSLILGIMSAVALLYFSFGKIAGIILAVIAVLLIANSFFIMALKGEIIADEDKLEKILENPSVIKTPVVRNGKQSTLGYQPEVWKGWN